MTFLSFKASIFRRGSGGSIKVSLLILVMMMMFMGQHVLAAQFYSVANGVTVSIKEFFVCRTVLNNSPNGLTLFVPTKTTAEFKAFLAAPPPGVTVGSCASPSPTSVYSMRRAVLNYSGNAIQVRRSSNDDTSDIGFTATDDLDVAALTTFCAATSCYVSIWYDQSGNGRNSTQTTNALQPRIVSAGVYGDGLSFLSSTYLNSGALTTIVNTNGQDGSVILVAQASAGNQDTFGSLSGGGRWAGNINWSNNIAYFDPGTLSCCTSRVSFANGAPHVGSWRQYSFTRSGATVIGRRSGLQEAINTGATGAWTSSDFYIGGAAGSSNSRFGGKIKEFVTYSSGLSGTDLTDLEGWQKSFWSTP